MTPAELKRAHVAMQALKFHPRETLPSRTTLARAEALHVQLRGELRARLRESIHLFESSLESQETELIEPAREHLQALIEVLSRSV